MEEASRQNPDTVLILPEKVELTKLQKDIYMFLLREKPQKALPIAKAMGKIRARDVNPDLYKMQGWNLLHCNEDKLWSIKTASHASEHQKKTGPTSTIKPTPAPTTSPLKDLQREILTLLEKSGPKKATDIAKGVGKTTAKDVNPDLYTMKAMHLLTYSKQDKLWTVKCQKDTSCKERDEDSEDSMRSSIPSDSNTDDSTSLNQSEIENQDNQLCNGTQCNNDTGTASPDHQIVDGQNITQTTTGPNVVQTWTASPDHQIVDDQNITQTSNGPNVVQTYAQTTIQPTMVNHYNIYIQNSQNFSVGEGVMNVGCSQTLVPVTGDSFALADASGAQNAILGAEQQFDSEEVDSTQTDSSLNVSNYSDPEEIQGRPPRTSSPADPDQSQQRINISSICDGIEQLDLEQQDGHLL